MSDPLATGDPFVEWAEANAARDEVDHDDELAGLAESVADSIRGHHPTTDERIDQWAREADLRIHIDNMFAYCLNPAHASHRIDVYGVGGGGLVGLIRFAREHWTCEAPEDDEL